MRLFCANFLFSHISHRQLSFQMNYACLCLDILPISVHLLFTFSNFLVSNKQKKWIDSNISDNDNDDDDDDVRDQQKY